MLLNVFYTLIGKHSLVIAQITKHHLFKFWVLHINSLALSLRRQPKDLLFELYNQYKA